MFSSVGPISNDTITTADDPILSEAMHTSPTENALWQSAIMEEGESLGSPNAWKLDRNPNHHPLPSHVILKIKRNVDISAERFEARIVAGGNFPTYGEYYLETYALVVSLPTVRLFVYLAVNLRMFITQVDVKTEFLNC